MFLVCKLLPDVYATNRRNRNTSQTTCTQKVHAQTKIMTHVKCQLVYCSHMLPSVQFLTHIVYKVHLQCQNAEYLLQKFYLSILCRIYKDNRSLKTFMWLNITFTSNTS